VTRVAYATWDGVDDERELLVSALVARDVACEPTVWHDPSVAWSSYDLVVVRSCWDSDLRRDEFLTWVRDTAAVTPVLNPPSVLERNTDKTYLHDMAAAGVPVVPTLWFAPGEQVDLDGTAWGELVVKPAISAGARDTIRTTDIGQAGEHAAKVLAMGKTAMVQPYLPMVEAEGETSLLFFGGRLSHVVRRGPMLVPENQLSMPGERGDLARRPDDDQLRVAEQVLAAVPERDQLLYARVDLVRDEHGDPLLIEVELTEPYLFLRYDEGAPARFADAVCAALGSSG
jgi:glutathione synthase/RimK-type ligase-like ATP-grasp enzyme